MPAFIGEISRPAKPFKPKPEVVHTLRQPLQLSFRDGKSPRTDLRIKEMPHCPQSVSQAALQTIGKILDAPKQLLFGLADNFRCSAWSWRPPVCNEVCDRKVDFMADSCDHRLLRPDDGAGHPLFVERPEVFHRAAATRNQDHVNVRVPAEIVDAFHDLQ